MNSAVATPTAKRLSWDLIPVRKSAKVGMEVVMSEMTLNGIIPFRTPTKTFENPKAPKLTAVAAIALPRTAAETGLEQEKRKAAIKAGERKRM